LNNNTWFFTHIFRCLFARLMCAVCRGIRNSEFRLQNLVVFLKPSDIQPLILYGTNLRLEFNKYNYRFCILRFWILLVWILAGWSDKKLLFCQFICFLWLDRELADTTPNRINLESNINIILSEYFLVKICPCCRFKIIHLLVFPLGCGRVLLISKTFIARTWLNKLFQLRFRTHTSFMR